MPKPEEQFELIVPNNECVYMDKWGIKGTCTHPLNSLKDRYIEGRTHFPFDCDISICPRVDNRIKRLEV